MFVYFAIQQKVPHSGQIESLWGKKWILGISEESSILFLFPRAYAQQAN